MASPRHHTDIFWLLERPSHVTKANFAWRMLQLSSIGNGNIPFAVLFHSTTVRGKTRASEQPKNGIAHRISAIIRPLDGPNFSRLLKEKRMVPYPCLPMSRWRLFAHRTVPCNTDSENRGSDTVLCPKTVSGTRFFAQKPWRLRTTHVRDVTSPEPHESYHPQ